MSYAMPSPSSFTIPAVTLNEKLKLNIRSKTVHIAMNLFAILFNLIANSPSKYALYLFNILTIILGYLTHILYGLYNYIAFYLFFTRI